MAERTWCLCPRCGAVSWNPGDVEAGYCGACHDFTRGDRPPRYVTLRGWGLPDEGIPGEVLAVMNTTSGGYVALRLPPDVEWDERLVGKTYAHLAYELRGRPCRVCGERGSHDGEACPLYAARIEARRGYRGPLFAPGSEARPHPVLVQLDELLGKAATPAECRELVRRANVASGAEPVF